MKTTTVTGTTKGHRIWLQDLCTTYGWPVGERYHVTFELETIVLQRAPEGKRKVAKGKGGIIDLTSQKVTRWAQGADRVSIFTDRENGRIFLTK